MTYSYSIKKISLIPYLINMITKNKLVKTVAKPKINVITLGCSKNTYDSEVLMGQLRGNNLSVEHESNQLGKDDIVVINTCGFIDNAKQESIDTILQYSQLKDEGKVGKVIVTGCLSERYKILKLHLKKLKSNELKLGKPPNYLAY